MSIYMKVEGVDGSVTAKGFEKWIELHSFQMGVHRAITMHVGNAANRAHGKPEVSEITVAKNMEDSSAGLFKESLSGAKGKKISIKVVESGATLKDYVTYDLEDAFISAYSVSTGGAVPVETITISYAKILVSFATADKNNKAGATPKVSYDLTAAQVG